jgi:hypothetical protein
MFCFSFLYHKAQHRKLTIEEHEPILKTGGEIMCSVKYAVPVPLLAPVVSIY